MIRNLNKSNWILEGTTLTKNRSFSGGISERYALALLELSSEANKTDEYVSILSSFMTIYNSDDNLKNYIQNPTNTIQNQKEVWEKTFSFYTQLTGVLNKYLKPTFILYSN